MGDKVNNMGNCKDCKHWHAHIDAFNKRWNTCEAPNWVDYANKVDDDGFALYADASDDSGLCVGLKTGPMFGCIKFLQRNAKSKSKCKLDT